MSSASPSLSQSAIVEDKATKKVRMRCDQSGIEEQVMVMEDTETPKGLEEKPNERLSFKDILVGSLKSLGKVVQGSEKNDLQLLESDVSIGIEDGLLSITFSEWVHQRLLKDMCNARLEQEEQNGEEVQSSVVIGESSLTNRDVKSENFGPWMLVNRRSKRTD
ncbi:hypothetical protein Gotri_027938 [Gossypium trilobum]|uniref:Uncharacterized protein n=1 Tax=Gossypium trilobum TaxID=34281 RepID=A0A7J9FP35_9ROSI|nr:hypothetical protein [Gossypium trilobum]